MACKSCLRSRLRKVQRCGSRRGVIRPEGEGKKLRAHGRACHSGGPRISPGREMRVRARKRRQEQDGDTAGRGKRLGPRSPGGAEGSWRGACSERRWLWVPLRTSKGWLGWRQSRGRKQVPTRVTGRPGWQKRLERQREDSTPNREGRAQGCPWGPEDRSGLVGGTQTTGASSC